MPKIIFIEHDGEERIVEAVVGNSIMQSALDNLVKGIVGECGGCCSCATCHAYIDPEWVDKVPTIGDDETSMLEGALDVLPNSRLTCQINVTDEFEGLIVRMPASQY